MPQHSQTNSTKNSTKIVLPKLLTVSLVILVLAFNIFGYQVIPGLGLSFYFSAIFIALYLSLKPNKKNLFTLSLTVTGIILNLFNIFRASEFIHNFNLSLSSGLLVLLFFYNTFEFVVWNLVWWLKQILAVFPKVFEHGFTLSKKIKQSKAKVNLAAILKTAALSLVTVGVFAVILASADPIFSQIITEFLSKIYLRIIFSLILSLGFLIAITFSEKPTDQQTKLKLLSFNDIFITNLGLVLLFASFIFIQFKYLFISHADFQSFDLTYSQYTRKGFTQLLFAGALGSIFSYLALVKKAELTSQLKQLQLKITNGLIVTEIFLILGSALKRDIMYIQTYGLTRIRIAGLVFIGWMGLSLIAMLIFNLIKYSGQKLLLSFYTLGVIAALVMNSLNIDQIVAQHQPADDLEYTDYFYINNLSADASAGWEQSIKDNEQELEKLLKQVKLSDNQEKKLAVIKLSLISLQEKTEDLQVKYLQDETIVKEILCQNRPAQMYHHCLQQDLDDFKPQVVKSRKWQSLNLSELRAFNQIQQNRELYTTKLENLLNQIENYQNQHNLDLYQAETWRLNEFETPLLQMNLDYTPRPRR